MDNLTIIKLLRIQNESLLALLHMHTMLPEINGYRTHSREIRRVGDDLRKVKKEIDTD